MRSVAVSIPDCVVRVDLILALLAELSNLCREDRRENSRIRGFRGRMFGGFGPFGGPAAANFSALRRRDGVEKLFSAARADRRGPRAILARTS